MVHIQSMVVVGLTVFNLWVGTHILKEPGLFTSRIDRNLP
jgi:hypothetical protein